MDKLYDRCLRCNRKLKTDEARKLGYGKICFSKIDSYKVINLLDKCEGSWKVEERKETDKRAESNSIR